MPAVASTPRPTQAPSSIFLAASRSAIAPSTGETMATAATLRAVAAANRSVATPCGNPAPATS